MAISNETQVFENSIQYQPLRKFFKRRLSIIEENKYPIVLTADPPSRFVMHLVPERYQEISFDIKKLSLHENYCLPPGGQEEFVMHDYNFDGMLFSSIRHAKHRYTQVFRNGIVEAVLAFVEQEGASNLFGIYNFQTILKAALTNYLATYKKFSVPGPYYLFMRGLHVDGVKLDPEDVAKSGYDPKGTNKPLVRNKLVFPVYKIENTDIELDSYLLPIFDILWNTFGFSGMP